ncbi:MAG: transcription-repair coupling factor [Aaplasma endosymbiont of Hyalomma asiaticum]
MSSWKVITGAYGAAEDIHIAEICLEDSKKSVICILGDDKNISMLSRFLEFFISSHDIFLFPAWNRQAHKNLPSSRVGGGRVQCLLNLASATKPYILIAPASATLLKVLPKDVVSSLIISIHSGQKLSMDTLTKHLVKHGYAHATSIVQEAGSFISRGEIVDIFQPTDAHPIRIYFHYDTVESIRAFNLDTQITYGDDIPNLVIYPASEAIVRNPDVIADSPKKDCLSRNDNTSLLRAMETQREIAGEYGFFPTLKENELQTLFDYVEDAKIIIGDTVSENIPEQIDRLRKDWEAREPGASPSTFFLDHNSYGDAVKRFDGVVLCRLDAAPKHITDAHDKLDCFPSTVKVLPDFKSLTRAKYDTVFRAAADYMKRIDKPVILACYSDESMQYLSEKFRALGICSSPVSGFKNISNKYSTALLPIHHSIETENFVVIAEQNILGRQYSVRKTQRTNIASTESDLSIGDTIVHIDYGTGIFNALRTMKVCGSCHDFLEILYRNNDKLFVPVEDTGLVTKYNSNSEVVLDKLGSSAWQEKKAKLKKRICDIAKTLLRSEAMRKLSEGEKFFSSPAYADFCSKCPYVETEDQLKAIADVENDLASGKAMDRLICGDVGFGKTEVALRAAFLVVNEDITCQVAVIVPTTLLCRQHFIAFQERFKNHPVNIKQLSRLSASKKVQIRQGLEDGSINIVIGTSALLSEEVKFLDLRLLIIDEEQHFGVQQKEKLRLFKHNVHVLSLSATPIPRTLHMSLSGIKDISILKTPPLGRTAVEIAIIRYDNNIIKTAITNEINRNGRVFFICPLISDVDLVFGRLQRLMPDVKIAVAHGKTAASALDKIMNDFFDGKFSVLLTTSIVESGIDIPFANTMIIYNADMFGLAQLYQLKGRVGRSTVQGYAYFVLSAKATANSPGMRRLETLKSLNSMGSGFSLSLQDMDMRGFGNLVGEEQSGNIKEVGIELYHRMLDEEIEACRLSTDNTMGNSNVKVDINANVRIPESYIKELDLRMRVYKKIGSIKTPESLQSCISELNDRFGTPPDEVLNLLDIMQIKYLCPHIGISEVSHFKNHIILLFRGNLAPQKALLKHLVYDNAGIFTVQGSSVSMIIPASHKSNVTKYVVSHLSQMYNLLSCDQ